MIILIPAMAGALIVGGVITLVVGLRPTEEPARTPRRRRMKPISKQTQRLLMAGVVVGMVAAIVTDWALA